MKYWSLIPRYLLFLAKRKLYDVRQQKSSGVTLKSALMEEALLRKGLTCVRVNDYMIRTNISGVSCLFWYMNGPLSGLAVKTICDQKALARNLLSENGLNVPESLLAGIDETDKLTAFADMAGYPVVLKPTNFSRGKGVITGIYDKRKLIRSLSNLKYMLAAYCDPKIIIEKQFEGDDYRFFVVDGMVLSVTKRIRPNVIGDGVSDVITLIQEKNILRERNPYLKDFPLPESKKKLSKIYEEGRSLYDVPAKDETIYLSGISNLSLGGDSLDVTEQIHEGYKQIAVRAIQSIPGMYYGGVDVLLKEMHQRPDTTNHIVTEVEFSPAPVSVFPATGISYDMAGAILDFYMKYYGNIYQKV